MDPQVHRCNKHGTLRDPGAELPVQYSKGFIYRRLHSSGRRDTVTPYDYRIRSPAFGVLPCQILAHSPAPYHQSSLPAEDQHVLLTKMSFSGNSGDQMGPNGPDILGLSGTCCLWTHLASKTGLCSKVLITPYKQRHTCSRYASCR